eukprot:XP_011670425.1 PREDICTED: uncharacterized protein LOC105441210 [Strongylocentrotus purpuratus]
MSLHTADFASCVSGELADTGPLVPPSESKSVRGKKKEVKKRTLLKSDIPSGSRSSAMVSRPPDEANIDENVEVSAMEFRMNKMEAMLARVVVAIPGPTQTQSGHFSDESADLEDVGSDHEGEHYTSEPCVPNIAAKFAVPTGLGEPVDEEIANSASYLIMNRLEDKVLSDTSAKYLPPSNCEFLDTPKVNSAIWDNLSQRSRTRDLKLQRVQRSLTRGLSAFAQSLLSQTITETQQDSLALICNANYELNSLRKEFIKPEMNEASSHLCKPSAPVTKYLFGDELGKRMKDLKEEQQIKIKLQTVSSRLIFLLSFIKYHHPRNNEANIGIL